jgi:hypothetical protein
MAKCKETMKRHCLGDNKGRDTKPEERQYLSSLPIPERGRLGPPPRDPCKDSQLSNTEPLWPDQAPFARVPPPPDGRTIPPLAYRCNECALKAKERGSQPKNEDIGIEPTLMYRRPRQKACDKDWVERAKLSRDLDKPPASAQPPPCHLVHLEEQQQPVRGRPSPPQVKNTCTKSPPQVKNTYTKPPPPKEDDRKYLASLPIPERGPHCVPQVENTYKPPPLCIPDPCQFLASLPIPDRGPSRRIPVENPYNKPPPPKEDDRKYLASLPIPDRGRPCPPRDPCLDACVWCPQQLQSK